MLSNNQQTKVLFFGTPEFAVPTLERLAADPTWQIVGVVTQPDKPAGRSQQLTAPAVKVAASKLGLPVYQFPTLKDESAQKTMAALGAAVAVVVAYGKIIPQSVLDSVPHGFVNIHPSLLPKYRGASPIQSAMLAGELTTGVTVMVLDAEMDHGPILAQRTVDILDDDTAASLHHSLACEGADVLLSVLPDYLAGKLTPQPQDHAAATVTTLLEKDDGKIDWRSPAEYIDRHIRAMTPWPGAWTDITGKRVKVLKAHLVEQQLHVDVVQPEGKQPMDYGTYLRGNLPLQPEDQ